MEYTEDKFANAETTIDYVKKKVSFKYKEKKQSNIYLFSHHSLYTSIGAMFAMGLFMILFYKLEPYIELLRFYPELVQLKYLIVLVATLSSVMLITIKIFQLISLAIHLLSKTARKNYAKTNAWSKRLSFSYKIDMSKKYGKFHYVDDNQLILFDYSIVYFEYSYIGYNKLTKIQTKMVARQKSSEPDYIAIFTFKDKIKDGILIYK